MRESVAALCVLLVVSLGARPAFADTRPPGAARPAEGGSRPPLVAQEEKPAPASPAPRLQLQDEGPQPEAPEGARLGRRPPARAIDDSEEKPFWKSWIFWTITGVLIAGGAALVAYRSSGTSSSIAPCPPSVVVSLGCFGAGRQQ